MLLLELIVSSSSTETFIEKPTPTLLVVRELASTLPGFILPTIGLTIIHGLNHLKTKQKLNTCSEIAITPWKLEFYFRIYRMKQLISVIPIIFKFT